MSEQELGWFRNVAQDLANLWGQSCYVVPYPDPARQSEGGELPYCVLECYASAHDKRQTVLKLEPTPGSRPFYALPDGCKTVDEALTRR